MSRLFCRDENRGAKTLIYRDCITVTCGQLVDEIDRLAARVDELQTALSEIAELASWHADIDADPSDTSPQDMAAHVNGLIVRAARAAGGET